MAIKKLRTDKTFQQFISELKKKKTGENTSDREFEDLPDENATEQELEVSEQNCERKEPAIVGEPA